jgi:C1A family cysteine protease
MKKQNKIGIVILIIFLGCSFALSNSACNYNKILNITDENNEYKMDLTENQYVSIMPKSSSSEYTVMSNRPPMNDYYFQIKEYDPDPKPISSSGVLPSQFSWRDNGGDWTTPAKNQGSCGSCYIFAVIGAFEAAINIASGFPDEDLDLSEQYCLSCINNGNSGCDGGWGNTVAEAIFSTASGQNGNDINGCTIESCMPYQADDTISCDDKCSDWDYHTNPPQIDNKLWQIESWGWTDAFSEDDSDDWDTIKTWLLEYGPMDVDIYVSDSWENYFWSHHSSNDVYEQDDSGTTNHEVVLVGWVDDSSILNGGYWICKNSWGTGFGYGGFFNIAYGCNSFSEDIVCWIKAEKINHPPEADANGPYTEYEDTMITFDASGSTDPDGDPLEYRWDFENDGTWDTSWSSSPYASHTWSDDYSCFAKVEVSDGILTDIDTAQVIVENKIPSITSNPLISDVDENVEISLSATAHDVGSDDLTFTWDWGDGTSTSTIYYNNGVSADPYPSTDYNPITITDPVTHTYGDDGTFTICLTIEDDDGGSTVYTEPITINNVDPTVSTISLVLPYSDNPDFILPLVHTLPFTATATDPGSDDLTFVWDWDDGTSDNITIYLNDQLYDPDPNPSPEINPRMITDTAMHIYDDGGTYTITLSVYDDDGGVVSTTFEVIVLNAEEAKDDINDFIQGLDNTLFKPKAEKRKTAFDNMFSAQSDMLEDEDYNGFIHHLRNDVREKCDGYIDGKKFNDWILGITLEGYNAQWHICSKIDDLCEYVSLKYGPFDYEPDVDLNYINIIISRFLEKHPILFQLFQQLLRL